MARYDYKCPACGEQFEVEHPMSEHPEVLCPQCGEKANQVFGASGIVFKGSGFYNTDQRGKGSHATAATSSPDASKKDSSSKEPSKKADGAAGASSGAAASSDSSK